MQFFTIRLNPIEGSCDLALKLDSSRWIVERSFVVGQLSSMNHSFCAFVEKIRFSTKMQF
jgi:hypothetical protein